MDPQTGEVPATIEEQTRQTLYNVQAVLEAAGASLEHVVKTTVHLADLSYWAAFDAAYREVMSAPLPARTTVGSQLAGILVEIDAVAVLA
jgi:enamine deaminase RidA (YjgF/YER057c/UK114 family)